ncbi:hypothetical protein [Marinicella meishanensis]|uniref:hypothetical protein n=1 Tax=Marinicella meishanensis TaxID=2873263 RepID=UPI001CBBF5B1|nr:hypothetical protein [Marinicella sp. NBU2979]
MRKLMTMVLLLLSHWAQAITWRPGAVPDPLLAGAECQVNKPASYGGYIYRYPSRFDFVFWPYTDPNNIWYCEQSGYMGFMPAFEEVGAAEKPQIIQYIKDNTFNPDDLLSKIQYLEGLYAVRDLNDEFRNKLLRVFARYHQEAGLYEQADAYRQQALAQIDSELVAGVRPELMVVYLYLGANYHRQFGHHSKSDEYLLRLHEGLQSIEEESLQDLKAYLLDLAPLSQLITPGGALEPNHELIEQFEQQRRAAAASTE